MNLQIYVPHSLLREFVNLFWHAEGNAPEHAQERVLPDGTMQLVISLNDSELPADEPSQVDRVQRIRGAVVNGTRTEFLVIDANQQSSTMGVHFNPGGAFFCLGMPASELRGTSANLDELWGESSAELREQLLTARSVEERFRILEGALLARYYRQPNRNPVVAFALKRFREDPSLRISEIMEQLGLSQRRFIEVFDREVGLTPKQFCRIRRFQDVLRQIHGRPRVDWKVVAYDCGYYDQSHLVRDFRAFSGLNPSLLLDCQTGHRNHLAVLDEG